MVSVKKHRPVYKLRCDLCWLSIQLDDSLLASAWTIGQYSHVALWCTNIDKKDPEGMFFVVEIFMFFMGSRYMKFPIFFVVDEIKDEPYPSNSRQI